MNEILIDLILLGLIYILTIVGLVLWLKKIERNNLNNLELMVLEFEINKAIEVNDAYQFGRTEGRKDMVKAFNNFDKIIQIQTIQDEDPD